MTCKVTGSTNDIPPKLYFRVFNDWNDWNHWNESLSRFPSFNMFESFQFASCPLSLLDGNVSIIVDCSALLRMNHCRRIQLLDHRRAGNLLSWLQQAARVDMAVQHTMLLSEVDFPLAGLRFINSSSGRLCRRKLRLGHEPVGNQPETDQFHRLRFRLMAGSLCMLCVEALPHQIEIRSFERRQRAGNGSLVTL